LETLNVLYDPFHVLESGICSWECENVSQENGYGSEIETASSLRLGSPLRG